MFARALFGLLSAAASLVTVMFLGTLLFGSSRLSTGSKTTGWVLTAGAGAVAWVFYREATSSGRKGKKKPPAAPTDHGSAHLAYPEDMKRRPEFTQPGGLIVGRYVDIETKQEYPLYDNSPRHLLTVAPTRSGKGVSGLIPNLLLYSGSMFVIDPKGENTRITARRRRELGNTVHVLDPWGLATKDSACLNPLDWLTPFSPDLVEDSLLLADALIISRGGKEGFWDDEGRSLLQGLLLHVATAHEEEGKRHLGRVRELITSGPVEFKALLKTMRMNIAADGLVARLAASMESKSENELSGVLSTVKSHTNLLDLPRLRKVLEKSTFRLEDLKRQPTTVFLVLPSEHLSTCDRWLRLLVSLTLAMMSRETARPSRPVVFMLDEFAALGVLKSVETAYGLMAGYGMKIWAFVQDLNQLSDLYEKRWQSFIANSGIVQIFGVNDQFTAEEVSKMLGVQTIEKNTVSTSISSGPQGSTTKSYAQQTFQRPLMTPDEVRGSGDMGLGSNAQIILSPQFPPIACRKLSYFKDAEFRGLFDSDPGRINHQP